MKENKINFNWEDAEKALINTNTRGMPLLSLNKHGYIRINNSFSIQNKLEDKKYVEVRYMKREEYFTLAFKFVNEKTLDTIKIYLEPKSKSLNFSLTATLKILDFNYKNLKKPLNLKPVVQEVGEDKILVSKIISKP
jgi:hypothetical protein